ncbi:N-6 DNA methylase [Methanobrevibacter sp.]|uniref:N-6 DNA methylase n=1 Tax=Methanobrevibacter sp. TaxID=66852 RepID=UPI00388FFE15
MRPSRSRNYKILRNILSQTRQIDFTQDISYLIINAFLYKYASDLLKDYLMTVLEDSAIPFDEAYENDECRKHLRDDALKTFGYFIDSPNCFIDEVINQSYSERFFIHRFFTSFTQHLEFSRDSNYEKYFTFLFDTLKREVNINKFEFEGENHLIVKEIIILISRLDVMEEAYPFEEVFDQICRSKLIRTTHDPEYVTQVLSAIVSSAKMDAVDVYNPFFNDGASLIALKNDTRWANTYGKCADNITYCASIVKMLLSDFDLDKVFLDYSSPFESVDINNASFDVIVSRIPSITPRNYKRFNRRQNIERVRNTKRKQLIGVLSDDFAMDGEALMNDEVINSAIDDILKKMDLEKEAGLNFQGEYESLKDSEYLFLINLINSLNDDGIMAVSMAQSFLSKNSLQTLRKYLTVEKNYIDAIISLPDELSKPRPSDIIVVFRKNRSKDDIVFVDMSKNYETSRLKHTVPGMFRRNLVFDGKTMYELIDVLIKRIAVERFSNVVDLECISENEFNLSISRYVDTFEGEFVSLRDLKYQKEEIDENLKRLNKKIDMMLSDLNIRF